ncbi:hypothetical protein [Derxia lacustris]|uniref:hypothetical protein n=1 Tax=Derxia lacustris TaxID=764842 RepID=UPI001C382E24|nr:hypothetical protein [Derxia lacustris]
MTLSDLPGALLNLDSYGDFLRGLDVASGKVEDEPRHEIATVLTFQLAVEGDLEPVWSLFPSELNVLASNVVWHGKTALLWHQPALAITQMAICLGALES